MGCAAQAHIREHYVGDLHLLRYERLFSALTSEGQGIGLWSIRGAWVVACLPMLGGSCWRRSPNHGAMAAFR